MASIHVEEPAPEEEQQDLGSQEGRSSRLKQQVKSVVTDPNKRAIIIVIILVLAFGAYTLKVNSDKNSLEKQLADISSEQISQDENEGERYKQEISQFLELPEDEIPTVATVVDAQKVSDQAFFKNSQNGDKVLIFATTGKAILYRPEAKKIIEVAPINIGQAQGQDTAEEGVSQDSQ